MAIKMRIGWLWFDNDANRTVEEKVRRAAEQYREKFGHIPNICYVHPQAIAKKERQCGKVRVIAAQHILHHHFWLGVKTNRQDQSQTRAAA